MDWTEIHGGSSLSRRPIASAWTHVHRARVVVSVFQAGFMFMEWLGSIREASPSCQTFFECAFNPVLLWLHHWDA